MKTQKQLSDYQEDIIRTKAKILEQEMWEASRRDTYVLKRKFSLWNFLADHPRFMVIVLAPTSVWVVAIISELLG